MACNKVPKQTGVVRELKERQSELSGCDGE